MLDKSSVQSTTRGAKRPIPRKHRRARILSAIAISVASIAVIDPIASGQTWNNPNTGNWSAGGNWIGGTPPTSSSATSLVFNALAAQNYLATQNIANPFTLNAIAFNPASTGTISLAGSTIDFAGTNPIVTMSGSGTVSIANALQLTGNLSIGGAGAGTILVGGALSSATLSTGTLGAMLTQAFPGTLALSGGGTLYAMKLSSGTTNITAGNYTLTSTQVGSDSFGGVNDGGSLSLAIGAAGSSAWLNVSGGASLDVQNAFAASEFSSTATLTLSGASTRLTAASRLGTNYGVGTIIIQSGAIATAQFVELGRQAGSSGNLIVSGASSTLNCAGDFGAPFAGSSSTVQTTNSGIINVGGNLNAAFSTDGFGAIHASTSSIALSGASQINCVGDGQSSGVLFAGIGDVGVTAAASININSAAALHTTGALLGNADGFASIAISGSGSSFTNDGELDLNSNSTSTINISSAGAWTNGGNVFTATGASDKAQISVSGTNSLADLSNANQVIFSGDGGTTHAGGNTTISINSGGEMRANLISAADALASRATINIDGAGSKLTLQSALGDNLLIVGNNSGAIGSLNITNGGALNMTPTSGTPGQIFLAVNPAAQANVSVSGANSAITTGAAGAKLFIGGYNNGSTIDGGTANFSVLSGAAVDLKQLAYVGSKSTLTIGSGSTPAGFKSGSLVVNGTVNFNSGTLQSSGSLNVGGTIKLSSAARNGSGTPTNKKTLESGTLTMTGSGVIDLNDNDALFHSNTEAQISTFIRTARNNGSWNGVGITSLAAKNNPDGDTNLAAVTGQQYKSAAAHTGTTSFNGLALANSDIVVKYTFNGDVDLDGRVTGSDYARIDTTFSNQQSFGNIGGWFNGDFNYDGRVDGSDYAMIDFAFSAQAAVVLGRPGTALFAGPGDRQIILAGVDPDALTGLSFTPAERSLFLPSIDPGDSSARAVPEPAVISLFTLAVPILSRWRRRRLNLRPARTV